LRLQYQEFQGNWESKAGISADKVKNLHLHNVISNRLWN